MSDISDFNEERKAKALKGMHPVSTQTISQDVRDEQNPAAEQQYDGYVYSVSQFEQQTGMKVVDEEEEEYQDIYDVEVPKIPLPDFLIKKDS